MSALPKTYFSLEDYLALDARSETRFEYFNGEIVGMTGTSLEHNQIALNIFRALGDVLDKKGCDLFISDVRVKVSETGVYTYPDVVIVCGEKELDESADVDTLVNPIVLVEILSDSTETYDRTTKWAHYRQIDSLREYLLISQKEYHVEHFSRQGKSSWGYQVYESTTATISLPGVDLTLSMLDLYRKVFPTS